MNITHNLANIFDGRITRETIDEIESTLECLAGSEKSPRKSTAGFPLTIKQEIAVAVNERAGAVTAFTIQVPNTKKEARLLLELYKKLPILSIEKAIVSMKPHAEDPSFTLDQRLVVNIWFSGFLVDYQCRKGVPLHTQIHRHKNAARTGGAIVHFCILTSETTLFMFAETAGRVHVELPS